MFNSFHHFQHRDAAAILTDAVQKRRTIAIFDDGTVSLLRIYLEDELRELVAAVPDHGTFEWDIGTTLAPGLPIGLTHLVGIPKKAT
jgi:hypothetical protein